MDILSKLPGIFAILVMACTGVGAVIGTVISLYANRKSDKSRDESHTKTVQAIKDLAAAQQAVADQAIMRLTSERDDNRALLHEKRNSLQAAELKIKEMEMRPDISALFHASEVFYSEQTKVLTTLVESFRNHDDKVTERMQPIYESLEKMGQGITRLLERVDPQENETTRRRESRAREDAQAAR